MPFLPLSLRVWRVPLLTTPARLFTTAARQHTATPRRALDVTQQPSAQRVATQAAATESHAHAADTAAAAVPAPSVSRKFLRRKLCYKQQRTRQRLRDLLHDHEAAFELCRLYYNGNWRLRELVPELQRRIGEGMVVTESDARHFVHGHLRPFAHMPESGVPAWQLTRAASAARTHGWEFNPSLMEQRAEQLVRAGWRVGAGTEMAATLRSMQMSLRAMVDRVFGATLDDKTRSHLVNQLRLLCNRHELAEWCQPIRANLVRLGEELDAAAGGAVKQFAREFGSDPANPDCVLAGGRVPGGVTNLAYRCPHCAVYQASVPALIRVHYNRVHYIGPNSASSNGETVKSVKPRSRKAKGRKADEVDPTAAEEVAPTQISA